MSDTLGDRMKERYEDRTRYYLPRRTFAVIRVDGKAFHTFTRGCAKPYDRRLMESIDFAAMAMCQEMAGAVLAYTQSDEISVLLCDFKKQDSNGWFDYNIQKMASVAASIATANFNVCYRHLGGDVAKLGLFDARVFSIPDPVEVTNYLIWRQKDAERNSLQMAAQSVYSHKQLHGKSCADLHELLHAKGINWDKYAPREKRGGLIVKEQNGVERCPWVQVDCPIFAKDKEYLPLLMPVLGYDK
jgi:tRNA(His) 5'-end guanylyltransferase